MAWCHLLVAAIFEIGWAVGLKFTNGFTRLWPSLLVTAAMAVSLAFLALAVRTIPVSTGYALWTGIGALGTGALGVLLLGEPISLQRALCFALILIGVLGLKLSA